MKLSARNVITGTVSEIVKGAAAAKVKIDIGHGQIVTASITTEAVDDLALAIGDTVQAVIKATDVLIAK